MYFSPFPMMMGGRQSSISDYEDFEEYLEEREKKRKAKEKEKHKPKTWGFFELLTILLFTSPFVGMMYSWCIIALNKNYIELMSTLLK